MKYKKRNRIAAISTVVVLGLVALVFFNLPKPVSASNAAFDLTQIIFQKLMVVLTVDSKDI